MTAAPGRQYDAPIAGAPTTTQHLTLSSVDQILGQWLRVKANTSAFAASIRGPILGNVRASWSRTVSQVFATVGGSG